MSALKEYEFQLKICEYSKDKQGIEKAKSNSGNVYKELGEYDTALKCFNDALKISIEIGNRREEGISLANIGETLMEKGDFKKSREYLEKSLEIFKGVGDTKLEKVVLEDLNKIETKD